VSSIILIVLLKSSLCQSESLALKSFLAFIVFIIQLSWVDFFRNRGQSYLRAQRLLNGWQYGKWWFAESVLIRRNKRLMRAKTPKLPLSQPFAILRVVLSTYFYSYLFYRFLTFSQNPYPFFFFQQPMIQNELSLFPFSSNFHKNFCLFLLFQPLQEPNIQSH